VLFVASDATIARLRATQRATSNTRDVGVWLAAVWGRHAHHAVVADWFGKEADDIIFCRVTQMGLFLLLSNPAIMGDDAIDRSQAWRA
jgi:uncharacterized protein